MAKVGFGQSRDWPKSVSSPLPLPRTPLSRTAQNFALFFPFPPPICSLCVSLGVFSLNFGGVHILGTWHFKHHQNSTRRLPERHIKSKTVAGEGKKKARNFGPPPLGSDLFRPMPLQVNTSAEGGARTVMPRRVEASQGGGPNLEKVGARRVEPRKVEPNISRFFSPLLATFFCLSSLFSGSFRGILVVFEAPGP